MLDFGSIEAFKRLARQTQTECTRRMRWLQEGVEAFEREHGLPTLTQAELECEFEDLPESKRNARLKADMIASGEWKERKTSVSPASQPRPTRSKAK